MPKTSTASADAVAKASSATKAVEKPLSETVAAAKASSKTETSQTSTRSSPPKKPALQKAASSAGVPAAFSDGYMPPPMKPVDLSRATSEAIPAKKDTFGRYKSARNDARSPRRSGFFGFKKKRRPNKTAMKKAIQDILLSPAVSTELARQDVPKEPLKRPSRDEVLAMLKLYVPDIAKMKGRRGRLKVR